LKVLFLFLISVTGSADATNLNERAQDFVLESKRIEIPGHPYAFNPSIVNWRGAFLLSFRELPLSEESFPCPIQSSSLSQIGLQFLFDDFSLDGKAEILDLPGCMVNGEFHARSEDVRLITVDERLYIVYSTNLDEQVTEGGFRMIVGELDYDGTRFSLKNYEMITKFPGESPNIREKNWVPFDYFGQLFLASHINPHAVLYPFLDGSGEAGLWDLTKADIAWKWGEIRGGTPALRVGNQYLSFFHSSIEVATEHSDGILMPHYFIGAYTFYKHPPFTLTHISPTPIIGKDFYEGKIYTYYWKPVRVVFPCGFVFDQKHIWLFYGRQDHEIWAAKLDRKGLFDSLIPLH
jgi:predicted GH43/DUF377 family glycosyl hydrolase